MEGLSHRLVITAGDLQHQVFVQVVGDLVDGVNSGNQLVLLLSGDVEDSEGVLAPLALDQVPDPLDRVELTTLRREELIVKELVVEFLLNQRAVMHREVVHDNNSFLKGVYSF